MHELWDTLGAEEFRAFIFLLSYVSKVAHKTGSAPITIKTLSRISRISPRILEKTITKLQLLSVVRLEVIRESSLKNAIVHGEGTVTNLCEPRVYAGTKTISSSATNERTNEDNSTSPHCLSSLGIEPHLLFNELWEKYRSTLNARSIQDWSRMRKKNALERWNEHPHRDYWEKIFTIATESPFCRGQLQPNNGHAPFRANIDWFLKPDTCLKLEEGFYSGKSAVDVVTLDI
jgi:hypothetical protein